MIHIHVHTQSLFDADISLNKIVEVCQKNNWPGLVITDHGVVTNLYDAAEVFQSAGLKLGYGIEFYVDCGVLGRCHLIMMAKNNTGWKAMCKLITDSNRNVKNGFPLITMEMLNKYFGKESPYHGTVVVTSACMQGVIPAIFRTNDLVKNAILKKEKKQSNYMSPNNNEYVNEEIKLQSLNTTINSLLEEKSTADKLAKRSFKKKENYLAKLPKNSDDYKEAAASLEAEKLESKEAKKRVAELSEEISKLRKNISSVNKSLKKMQESLDMWAELEKKITSLKNALKSDEELMGIAQETAKQYLLLFEDDFYIEIQNHHIPEEKYCFEQSVKLARALNIPLVASNDVHTLSNSEDDILKRCILKSLRFGEWKDEQIGDRELYFKTESQMREALSEFYTKDVIDEAIRNTSVIFDKLSCSPKKENHYPKYKDETQRTSEEIFEDAIKTGIKEKFNGELDEAHVSRLNYEIGIIKKMGVIDYLLVVKDFLEYARLLGYLPNESEIDSAPLTIKELKSYINSKGYREPGFTTGPGRGSGVGSIVCYLLDITKLDPLKYGLLFERFLNPERITMPDIDSDLAKGVREKTIEFVRNKYGEKAVCLIMTKNSQAPKGCIRMAARFYGLKKYGESLTVLGDQIAKKIPNEIGIGFDSLIDKEDISKGTITSYLSNEYKDNKDAIEIIRWARILEGSFTAYGEHAAGVVISDNQDVSDYIPLRLGTSGQMDSQCNMVQVEDNGLLKMDFLGLKTLNVITDAKKMIYKNKGIIIDLLKLNMNDPNVYKNIFAKGMTDAVFQFESDGMKNMLKRFKPENFEDLIILVSMFRPGPLQYIDDVIKVKNEPHTISFLCPQLEQILGKTYGAIVYQEQVSATRFALR